MTTTLAERILSSGASSETFSEALSKQDMSPLFVCGDALETLRKFPSESIDSCLTSPPYWGKREYDSGGIGLEPTHKLYIDHLAEVFSELRRVLKLTGSFWLNIGDSYQNKALLGIPWRLALRLVDTQGWVLRNSVIWNKVKGGPDNTCDRLRNIHEDLFHFVKSAKDYYYDSASIRTNPHQAKVVNGAIVSATGVTGVRYRRQIELSTSLTESGKETALSELENMLDRIRNKEIADFRMIIRGQQRTTHSDSTRVSGRAKELATKGFYFLIYHPDGSKPSDVWEIIPEDTQKREAHFAPYPEDLCRIPILSTCPPGGVVLDPFVGTGTTTLVAFKLQRRSIGIDISAAYLRHASERCNLLL
jgi:DNA modification methylase